MEPDSATTRLALLALLLLAAPARPASAAPVEDGTLAEPSPSLLSSFVIATVELTQHSLTAKGFRKS
jgi:hypothetical protein